ncbi:hypothetical protein FYJ24_09335 [Actinomycetaceae bacterium WB03_NA08]|uniref:Uncharacterized protein n=1 Tax=Scrofimicrobium canadense TaxID=2652290 RepID=A0A6N7W6F2_9ACTO|nr:hypothetical protein [Scrofimicrobium canadense]MSS84961.1 hypothetical protein [Scrofimicrobium canadense]
MRFPYQRTTGTLLREAFRVQRAQSSARNLGLSSITKGEGSIDLLATDTATTPEVSIGDLPGGLFGIGLKVAGSIKEIGRHITDSISTATQPLKDRIGSLEGWRVEAASAIAQERRRNDNQDSRLATLEGKPDGPKESDFQKLRDEVAALKEQVRKLQIRADMPGGLPEIIDA